MYNGIGLQTPRGSGTNGYIQTNKFFVRPRTTTTSAAADDKRPFDTSSIGGVRKANKDILEHDRKRQIQLKILQLQETLEDQGYTDSEIAERIAETVKVLEAEAADAAIDDGGSKLSSSDKRYSDTQSHQVAARKEKQLETLRAALGIKQEEMPSKEEMEEQELQNKLNDSESEESDALGKDKVKKDSKLKHFDKGDINHASQGKHNDHEKPEDGEIRADDDSNNLNMRKQKQREKTGDGRSVRHCSPDDKRDERHDSINRGTKRGLDKNTKSDRRHDSDFDSDSSPHERKEGKNQAGTKRDRRQHHNRTSQPDDSANRIGRGPESTNKNDDKQRRMRRDSDSSDSDTESTDTEKERKRRHEVNIRRSSERKANLDRRNKKRQNSDESSDSGDERAGSRKIVGKKERSTEKMNHGLRKGPDDKINRDRSSRRHDTDESSDSDDEKVNSKKSVGKTGRVVEAIHDGLRKDPDGKIDRAKRNRTRHDTSESSDSAKRNSSRKLVGSKQKHQEEMDSTTDDTISYGSDDSSDMSSSSVSSDDSEDKYCSKARKTGYKDKDKQLESALGKHDRGTQKIRDVGETDKNVSGRKDDTVDKRDNYKETSRKSDQSKRDVMNIHHVAGKRGQETEGDMGRGHIEASRKLRRKDSYEYKTDNKNALRHTNKRSTDPEEDGLDKQRDLKSRKGHLEEDEMRKPRESRGNYNSGHTEYGGSRDNRKREGDDNSVRVEYNVDDHVTVRNHLDEQKADDAKRKMYDDHSRQYCEDRYDNRYNDIANRERKRHNEDVQGSRSNNIDEQQDDGAKRRRHDHSLQHDKERDHKYNDFADRDRNRWRG